MEKQYDYLNNTLEKVYNVLRIATKSKPFIEYSSNTPTAHIEYNKKEDIIKVNSEFIKKITENSSLKYEEALEGVIQHELGHLAFSPYSLENKLYQIAKAHKYINNEKLLFSFLNLYNDFRCNIMCVKWYEKNNIKDKCKIPDIYKALESGSKLEKILKAAYKEYTKEDFGEDYEDLDVEMKNKVNKLKNVLILRKKHLTNWVPSRKEMEKEMRLFYKVIKDYLADMRFNNERSMYDLKKYLERVPLKEIRKSIRRLVNNGEIEEEDIKNIYEILKNINKEVREEIEKNSKKENVDPVEFTAKKDYYLIKASKYNIKIEPDEFKKTGSLYPTSKKEFSIEDDPLKVDFTSNILGNEIIPGVTPTLKYEELLGRNISKKVSDYIILLDDSGSMPNPINNFSNAVFSAIVAAKEVIQKGGKVAPGVFSTSTIIEEYTDDLEKVVDIYLTYRDGWYTELDVDKLKKFLEKNSKNKKVVIITDGELNTGISFEEFIDIMSKYRDTKTFILNIQDSKSKVLSHNVYYYGVKHIDDIRKVVLK